MALSPYGLNYPGCLVVIAGYLRNGHAAAEKFQETPSGLHTSIVTKAQLNSFVLPGNGRPQSVLRLSMGWRFWVRIPVVARYSFFPEKRPDRLWGPLSLLLSGYRGGGGASGWSVKFDHEGSLWAKIA